MRLAHGGPLLLAILAACTSKAATDSAHAAPPGERRPVVVELFSSEGCSSCPPADSVLSALAAAQPVAGAEIIPLELHVDYWNYLGWEDPFSSPAFTARQQAYATAFAQRGVYTPQMVIDGRAELVGSRAEAARTAIAVAARTAKAKVRAERRGDALQVSVGELPDATEAAAVWLAITESGLRVPVPRGENAGSTLAHAPIVRKLAKIGTIAAGAGGSAWSGAAPLSLDPAWKRENLRAVVFVQRPSSLHVVGATAVALGG